MRKFLAFLVLLMLPWMARGQALADWYYWFDQETEPHETGSFSGQQFQIAADVSHLQRGMHTLYVQVKNNEGIYSTPHSQTFYLQPEYGTKAHRFLYWFDGNATVKELAFGSGNYVLDVSTLSPGFHFINYMVTAEDGLQSEIGASGFYRVPSPTHQKLYYWLAGDNTATQVVNYADGFVVDVTRVREGFNTIYFQMDDNGPTNIQSENFIKVTQTENAGDMTLVCIIDGKVAGEEKVSVHGGVVQCKMDVSKMDVGMHKAMFQLIAPSGAGSSIAETYFIRTLTNDDVASMQCSYNIDGHLHRTQKGTCANGAFHFELPVEELSDGLHRIDYMLVAENGASTTQGSAWFIKTPLGGNGITQYDYWLNGKTDEKQSVVLETPADPFLLIKLLPVSSEPIRSSCFHFENKDNQPMMYAKNDIHFRFHDKSGRWGDADKRYVDYNVSQEVTDISDLLATQTFECPDSNCVKWFAFEAAPGDTIAFRSSQATSLQVFSPSGKEIFSVSEDRSVKYAGTHTWEEGTHYLAVHDVTGTKPELTLDYKHMDKYDVVSQDVRVVGNGGCSTITFQGHGFKDLCNVELRDLKGNTIQSIDIGHESDSETTVTFDFSSATLGKYDAIFHFTTEDRTLVNNVTVEEAHEIELVTKVYYPSAFLKLFWATYTVEITNKGNMTAYTVPVDLRIITDDFNDIRWIDFGGDLKSISMPKDLNFDCLEQEDINLVQDIFKNANDRCQFIIVKDSVTNKDYGFAHIIATIPPNTTQKLYINISSESVITLMAYTTKNWFSISATENNIRKVKSAKSPSKNSLCCMKEKFQCAADIIASFGGKLATAIPGVAGGNINCATAVTSSTLSLAFDVGCSDGENIQERIQNYAKSKAGSLANKLISTLVSCATGYYGPITKSLRDELQIAYSLKNWNEYARVLGQLEKVRFAFKGALTSIYKGVNAGVSGANCFTLSVDPIPNCPPNPDGGGGSATPVGSFDPNDIFGYVAQSGSKYVGEETLNLPYRIEFENDTTIATSSAHVVIVTDTLDSKTLDLTSYHPMNIKIGDKNVPLNGETEFVTTIDMRPNINAITQVEGRYDINKGIATWTFTSLDPMTMEPTDDIMQGFLPVNYDGSGIGEVAYHINRKAGLSDGTEISNKASIIFDSNDAIETPIWTNIVDRIAPMTHVNEVELVNDTIVRVHFDGEDNRSGIWKYALYVQYGRQDSWNEVAEMDSSYFDIRYYEDIDYGFCVLATDSAGNIEKKLIQREFSFLNGESRKEESTTFVDTKHTTNYIFPAYDLEGRLVQEERYRGNIIKNRKKILNR